MVAVATAGVVPGTINAYAFDRDRLSAVVENVVAARTAEARSRIGGLEPRRVDIIVAGAVLLEQIMIEMAIDEMVVSTYALREGVLLDRQAQRPDDPLHHLTDPRRASVEDVAAQFDPDIDHSRHATDLALAIFDEVAGYLGRSEDCRDTLEAAGRLHNVGLTISHASHHRHSYYVIRHSELLTGFTDHEIELIAQVARYHRKSAPKVKHPEFALLDRADQDTVRLLAGILRIAIGLDRTHSGVVSSVTCRIDDDGLTIEAAVDGRDASLELYTADERRGLLAEAMGMPVRIVLTEGTLVTGGPGGRAEAAASREPRLPSVER
jgi:exopolyphosphatase/guanosine-5'-triphosphate,3'-diphosphate pyrophosphatase